MGFSRLPALRNMAKLAAVGAIAAGLGSSPALASEPFSEAQKSALDAAIRDYIMAHPEVIVESLNAMQQRQEAAEQEQQRLALTQLRPAIEDNPNDPILGNPDGSVTVVEFFDYQCGYCKRMVDPVMQLLKQDPSVRWVMKELPILGPASVTAARASVAANNQGAYREFHLALMAYRGRLTDAAVFQTAVEIGLDIDKLKADMAAPQTEKTIRDSTMLARTLGVNGTPAFIIGDQILPGAVSLDTLVQLIEAARES